MKNWYEQTNERNSILPQFDVARIKKKGKEHPVWVHFGGGNLYRGFHAEIAQRLANKKELMAGVILCETFDEEIIRDVYQPYNQDILKVVMHEDGYLEKEILAATADSLYVHPNNENDYNKAVQYFQDTALQFITFTITEKGYNLKDWDQKFLPIIQEDIISGPNSPKHTISILTALLFERFKAGKLPLALVSTDNFSQNGQKFQESVWTLAKAWQREKHVPNEFIDYLMDTKTITFPWSMIDRITPNPSENIKNELSKVGFSDVDIIHTEKHTNIAAFVNTEAINYLVIEDNFPNGRPKLESAGVTMTNRETVDKADSMKVTTCLNPLHTALAVTGCLLGYTSIAEEMKDKDLVGLIQGIGYHEGLPVVESPVIIDPKQFIDEVLTKRLPNPYIPDSPQRIASDTSQKIAIRYGETIKKHVEKNGTAENLVFIPLTIAAWLRYLLAVDDQGSDFIPSPDPLLTDLQEKLATIKLGEQDTEVIASAVKPILENPMIVGSNLYQAGIGKKIESILKEMLVGPEAVRKTIHKYVTEFGGK
ncbi:MAG: mannitol dehydrogenase family protein [Enterococcus sp.]